VTSLEKSDLAFRTISEAVELLGVPAHVLRFWEGKFPQIKPLKRAGGRRNYRPEDMALLRGIRALLYEDGYQIMGVQKVIKEQGVAFVRARGSHDHAKGSGTIFSAPATSPASEALGAVARTPIFSLSQLQDETISGEVSHALHGPDVRRQLEAALAKLERAQALLTAVSQSGRAI
jgi:DNA-binding transcriptional MerR regulator